MVESRIALVVPCFNEALRFNGSYFSTLLRGSRLNILFVDDGSTDSTFAILHEFCNSNPKSSVLKSEKNLGKAEAVRIGMVHCASEKFDGVGMLDADGAICLDDVLRISNLFFDMVSNIEPGQQIDAILSSRVKLGGREINRNEFRHYIGRAIATIMALKWPESPYDLQCGFKIFKNSENFKSSLTTEFKTRWFVDAELLQRLRKNRNFGYWEEPLSSWTEISGSNIRPSQYLRIAWELAYVLSL